MKWGSGMWAMWAGGLWWILREDRSGQAASTRVVSSAEQRSSSAASLIPVCARRARECEQCGLGARGLCCPGETDGRGTRATTQQDQEAAGVAAELWGEGGLWRGQKAQLQAANQQRSLPVPVTVCLWKQNFKCSFAIKLSLISTS